MFVKSHSVIIIVKVAFRQSAVDAVTARHLRASSAWLYIKTSISGASLIAPAHVVSRRLVRNVNNTIYFNRLTNTQKCKQILFGTEMSSILVAFFRTIT